MQHNIREKFDAILADYDGTVLDSMMHLALNATEMYREHGIEVDPNEFICEYIQPFSKLHSHFGLKTDTEEEQVKLAKNYWEVSDRNNFRSEIFPEVLDVFKTLHRQGLQLGIISAAKRDAILSRFEEEGVSNLFDAEHVVGESDKKVEAILKFCEKNSLDPQRVLMIGDVPSDIDYGKQAKVKTAGFVYSGYDPEIHRRLWLRLEAIEPDYIFSDWQQLLDF